MFKDVLGDAFPLIEKFAPLIATAVSSPAAGAATMIGLNLLANAFGIKPSSLDKLGDSIVGDPNCEKKLCALHNQYEEWFKANMAESCS